MRAELSRWRFGAAILGMLAAGIGPSARAIEPPARPVVLTAPAVTLRQPERAPLVAAARAGEAILVGGASGVILRSEDGGRSWHQMPVPVGAGITAIAFADDAKGYAIGHFGVVLKTMDGGRNWGLVLDGEVAGRLAKAAAEADATLPAADRRRAERLAEQGPDKPLLSLDINDAEVMVFGAFATAYADRGEGWHYLARELAVADEAHPYGAARLGGDLYLAGELGLLLRRRAGEREFVPLASPYDGSFFGIVATPGRALLVFGLLGHAFRSADAGEHWAEVETGTAATINAATVLPDGSLALATAAGEILVSDDDGQRFRPIARRLPMMLTALVAAPSGDLVAAGLGGVALVSRDELGGGGR
jgi:photosystem II stability/assembly factor-like uncharacterized protein